MESQKWSILPHAPYSPDTNPCDFNCFGPLKLRLKDYRYSNNDRLLHAIRDAIHWGNQNQTFNGVSKLPEVWQAVI